MLQLLDEIRLLETRVAQLERHSHNWRASRTPAAAREIPGIGLLTATAILAATAGSVAHFKSARHFASWFGLTPKENSSGTCVAWVASPRWAIATCACSLPMAHAQCCAQPNSHR